MSEEKSTRADPQQLAWASRGAGDYGTWAHLGPKPQSDGSVADTDYCPAQIPRPGTPIVVRTELGERAYPAEDRVRQP